MSVKLKEKSGITLIALVITIIILLTLAGISISAITGDNGILAKAVQGREAQLVANEKDQIATAFLSCEIDLGESIGISKVTAEDLQEELIKNKNDVDTTSEESSDGYVIYVTFNDTRHEYMVDKNGNIKYMSGKEPNEKVDTSKIDKKMVRQEISYEDSLNTIRNPDRGFYLHAGMNLANVSSSTIQGYIDSANNNAYTGVKNDKNNVGILHILININELSGNVNSDGVDKDFTEAQIASINTMLDTVRKNKFSVILRFCYDFDEIQNREPKSFDTIKRHIEQLQPVFEANKDIISTLEVGFLGLYGEMHTAGKYESDTYYKQLIETLLANTPNEMTVNVRKPHFYKIVVGELNNSQHRLGIYNDGYLGSATDLGTVGYDGISREQFVNWMKTQGQYTLYGGEATRSGESGDEQYSDSTFALAEMPKTHTAYLNILHNLDVINKWVSQTYTSTDSEYDGKTAFKYISDHLGYRMVVRDSKISSSVEKGEVCGVNLEIENVGFGNIVRTQKVSVILRKDYEYYETTLNVNANSIKGGEKSNVNFYFYVPSDIEEGDWSVYLKVANSLNSDYSVQFANPDIWDSKLLANYIGKVTIEDSVAKDGVKIKQAFLSNAPEGTKKEIPVPTIPVTFKYQIEGGSMISSQTLNIPVGTTIDFRDADCLSRLGIVLPETSRTLVGGQCLALTGDWNYHFVIPIPAEPTESSYDNFFVYYR